MAFSFGFSLYLPYVEIGFQVLIVQVVQKLSNKKPLKKFRSFLQNECIIVLYNNINMQKISQYVIISLFFISIFLIPNISFASDISANYGYASGSPSCAYNYIGDRISGARSTYYWNGSSYVSIQNASSNDVAYICYNGYYDTLFTYVEGINFNSYATDTKFKVVDTGTTDEVIFYYLGDNVMSVYSDFVASSSNYVNINSSSTLSNGLFSLNGNYYTDGTFGVFTYSNGISFNIVRDSDDVILSSSSAVIGFQTDFNSAVLLNNGWNILNFGFTDIYGNFRVYKTVYKYYSSTSSINVPALDFDDFYSGIYASTVSQWQSVNDLCNLYNLISFSSSSIVTCVSSLILPSTTTLMSHFDLFTSLFPFNMVLSVYKILSTTLGNTPVIVSGTTPSMLGGTSFSFGLTSGVLDYLWNATSTGKFTTASSETFSQRVSRYLDPLIQFMFAIYVLSFFFRAFGQLGFGVDAYSRSSKRLSNSTNGRKTKIS